MRRAIAVLTVLALLGMPSAAVAEGEEPSVALRDAGPSAAISSMSYVSQSWNNCGPASVVMVLSTMGYQVSQEEARLALRGPDIRRGMPSANVDPWLRARLGLRAIFRTNGTPEQIKRFIANGYPVIVTQWLDDSPTRIAHYRVVRGYDDARATFVVNDPVRGAGLQLGYDWFVENWKSFSYRYMVLYRPEDQARVKALVGSDWDELAMRERLYLRTQADALRTGSASAWLSHGEAAYQFGKFSEAVAAFERGLSLGPASGIFTLRVSYPMSLRLVRRDAEANAAFARFAALASAPVRAPDGADPLALALFASRVEPLVAW
jgi:hypothetical protein